MPRSTLLLTLIVFLCCGCLKDKVTRTYTLLKPVYKAKQTVINEIGSQPATTLSDPGKIYVYGDYLFVNEINKGVHIIDNSNPAKPINTRFINIPGNVDIAVRGNTLYADIFTDMVTLDISDPLAVKVTQVNNDVFPERQYGNGFVADRSQYIVDWERKDTTIDFNASNGWETCCGFRFLSLDASAFQNASSISKATVGIAGSMARFSIIANNLYAVNQNSIVVFDILDHLKPEIVNTVPAGWQIETIYPFRDKLFLGSTTGMFIFDITNAEAPVYVSAVSHLRMCDPVIADDQYAYVTLRAGVQCGSITGSQLQVLDITNIASPVVLKTYEMSNPYGLAKINNQLWICDGTAGLKVFDATDPLQLKPKQHFKDLEPLDVIPLYNRVVVSAKEGIVQYDITNANAIKELSRIKKQ